MAKEICYNDHSKNANIVEEYKKALAELEEKRIFGRHVATYNAKGWAYNRILAFLYRNTNEYEDISTDTKSIRINLRRGCKYEDYNENYSEEYKNNVKVNARFGEFGAEIRECLGHITPSPQNRKCPHKTSGEPSCSMCSFIVFDKNLDTNQYDLLLREKFRQALEEHFGGKEKLKKLLRAWRNKDRPKRRVPRRKQETP